jgi:hypothetical protein
MRVVSFPDEFPDVSADPGRAAEVAAVKRIKDCAKELANKHGTLQFLIFHSVKYGITGKDDALKWESDIDIVLICFNNATGVNISIYYFSLLTSI